MIERMIGQSSSCNIFFAHSRSCCRFDQVAVIHSPVAYTNGEYVFFRINATSTAASINADLCCSQRIKQNSVRLWIFKSALLLLTCLCLLKMNRKSFLHKIWIIKSDDFPSTLQERLLNIYTIAARLFVVSYDRKFDLLRRMFLKVVSNSCYLLLGKVTRQHISIQRSKDVLVGAIKAGKNPYGASDEKQTTNCHS